MKTDRLENFIKTNREEFDQLEPSTKVWENISAATGKTKVIRLNAHLIRVAAVIVVVVVTSVLLFNTGILAPGSYAGNSSDPEMRELIEAETFYAQQVNGKLKEIRKCYYTFPELKEEIETDLIELEEMYNILKVDLKENVSKKAVIEAMIENNRFRLKLVDQVLEQINC
ncbi:MAG: hypothetical protein HN778_06265 [Prolixibacteraceae bacterium]|jgi:hypothetical protein|nr:hypothetical protein [Prolixibacteraceae bacterium]MBT6006654.1 hypothetical protein [Prolixibacteraceae bacterium]MBT6998236.1 hypothetical protein [Prolixibacteraceae bacterium]MBT7394419.1 hypothetical protein [Prolixibacteraceae bacterium]